VWTADGADGAGWEAVPSALVSSVNGETGTVVLNAADVGAAPAGLRGRRTTNLDRTSTTTAADDTELVVAAAANTTYRVEALCILGCASDSVDLNIGITAPSGATIDLGIHGVAVATTGNAGATRTGYVNSGSDIIELGVTSAVRAQVLVVGIVQIASTAGDVAIKWAQRTSSATALTMHAGSTLVLTPIP
jgi:uncharacterized protein with beta-barrel porin domain